MADVIEDEPITNEQVMATPASAPPEPRPVRWRSLGLRRIIASGIVGILIVLLSGWLFVDPIAHLWYQSRQSHLRAQTGSVLAPTSGQQVGVLQNVATGLNVVVAEGDTPAELRGGPGHEPGTPLPGHRGNSVIFGHRGNWGGPFKALDKLTAGSHIYVKSRSGQVFVYTVTSSATISSSDHKPFGKSRDFRLTLVTSAGGVFGDHLLVATAVSGPQKKLAPAGRAATSLPARESALLNRDNAGFLLRVAAAAGVIGFVRRRHQLRIALIIAAPVALSALLSLYLALDLVPNPLA